MREAIACGIWHVDDRRIHRGEAMTDHACCTAFRLVCASTQQQGSSGKLKQPQSREEAKKLCMAG
jgi:hypothetical protein